jgi:hypothetical protein
MSAALDHPILSTPPDRRTPPADHAPRNRVHLIDPADLWPAVDRVAGAAFCAALDPRIVTFAQVRIADHFGLPDEVVDAMIAARLLRLATRLSSELDHLPPR